ncbi:MAG TPA: universal stress protein [Candidatus Dormibacteraeota bacterium]
MRTPNPPHRLVVGLDGSDGSTYACHWCAALARSLHAEVVAVHAIEVPPYPLVVYEGGQPIRLDADLILQWQEDRRRLFESEWCAPLRHAGVEHRALMVDGDPAEAILSTAEEQHAGLIVVGRRGTGGLDELLLGSVSRHLTEHSRRPVSVVPPDRVTAGASRGQEEDAPAGR